VVLVEVTNTLEEPAACTFRIQEVRAGKWKVYVGTVLEQVKKGQS
jgi:ABC-type transporter MlaC component